MPIQQEKLPIATVLRDIKDWSCLREDSMSTFMSRRRIAKQSDLLSFDWQRFNINDYLLTHATIVASVNAEEDGYTIKESCADLVNGNGNAWLTNVLGPDTNMYRSFVGAENFYEHLQSPLHSKGKILDAVLRKVKHGGEDVWYVDILVATNKRHADLVQRIINGSLTTMSMGIVAHITQCSKCGKIIANEWDNCNHLKYELGQPYKTKYGTNSVVSELIGVQNQPESARFIEASWVENPAFKGAVINYYISDLQNSDKLVANASKQSLISASELDLDVLKKVRVADRKGMLSLKLYVKELEESYKTTRLNRLASNLCELESEKN